MLGNAYIYLAVVIIIFLIAGALMDTAPALLIQRLSGPYRRRVRTERTPSRRIDVYRYDLRPDHTAIPGLNLFYNIVHVGRIF